MRPQLSVGVQEARHPEVTGKVAKSKADGCQLSSPAQGALFKEKTGPCWVPVALKGAGSHFPRSTVLQLHKPPSQ